MRSNCTACYFMVMGVKTRRAIPHSCGRTQEQIREHVNERKKNNLTAKEIVENLDPRLSGYKQNIEKENKVSNEHNNSNMGSDSSN